MILYYCANNKSGNGRVGDEKGVCVWERKRENPAHLYYYYYVVNSVRAKSELFIVTSSSYYRVSALCFYASFVCRYLSTSWVYYILYYIMVDLITYYIRMVKLLFYTNTVPIMYNVLVHVYIRVVVTQL